MSENEKVSYTLLCDQVILKIFVKIDRLNYRYYLYIIILILANLNKKMNNANIKIYLIRIIKET